MDDLTRLPGEASSSNTLTSSGADRGALLGTWLVLLLGSLAMVPMAVFGFYASRGDEPLFGRTLLD